MRPENLLVDLRARCRVHAQDDLTAVAVHEQLIVCIKGSKRTDTDATEIRQHFVMIRGRTCWHSEGLRLMREKWRMSRRSPRSRTSLMRTSHGVKALQQDVLLPLVLFLLKSRLVLPCQLICLELLLQKVEL